MSIRTLSFHSAKSFFKKIRINYQTPSSSSSPFKNNKLYHLLGIDKHSKPLMRGGLITLSFRILGLSLGYVFTLIISRKYGAEAVGAFAMYITLLSIAVLLGKVGMDTVLVRFVSEYASQGMWKNVISVRKKATGIVTLVCVLLSAVMFLGFGTISQRIFNDAALATTVKWTAFSVLPVALMMINAESLRGLKIIGSYAFLQMASLWLFALAFLLITLRYLDDANAAILAYTASAIVVCILSFAFWHRSLKRNLKNITYNNASSLSLRKLMTIALPLLFTGSLSIVITYTDTIMLGVLGTGADVGIYNIVIRIASLTSLSLLAISSLAAPQFAEYHSKKNLPTLAAIVQSTTRLAFWTSMPVFLVIFIVPSYILDFFGPEFSFGAFALLVTTAGQLINVMSGAVVMVLQMTGRQNGCMIIIVVASTINVVLNFILIPTYGINGAAIACATSMIFWNVTSVIYAKQSLGIQTLYIPFRKWKS